MSTKVKKIINIDNSEMLLVADQLYIFNIENKSWIQIPLSEKALEHLESLKNYEVVYYQENLYIACGRCTSTDILQNHLCSIDLKTGNFME